MIELLVVATIMVVLSTIGLVSYNQAGQNARNGKRKADLETVRQALVLYRADVGSYPAGSSFTGMLTTIDDYISSTEIKDPRNEGSYVYTYSSDGVTFTLEANLEPDGSPPHTLQNP